MIDLSRRAALRGTALSVAALALLTRCGAVTENTTNGVTTITVNTAQINAWGQAFVNASKLVASLPGITGTTTGVAILAVGTVVGADLTAFNTAAKGSLSLTFNSTSIPAAVTSILTDGSTLLTDSKAALSDVAATATTTAQTYIDAVETVVSLFQAAVGSVAVGAALGATSKMTEAQALATLKVQ